MNVTHSTHSPIGEDFVVHPSRVLGQGYSGEVVVAVQRCTGIAYAVKRYATRESPSIRICCKRECDILRQIRHPHIAQLHGVYEDDAGASLVLHLYTGGELYHRLMRRQCFNAADAISSTSQMLLAINHLHQHNIVHRDVKLENWVYEHDAHAAPLRLVDFGFAREYEQGIAIKTRCGTLPYMAPEVLSECYTNKCDMWSLGVVVFALLTGEMPFRKVRDIKACSINQGSENWSRLSDEARDFVLHLLVLEKERMSASQSLGHKWLTSSAPQTNARAGEVGADTSADLTSWWSMSGKKQMRVLQHEQTLDRSTEDVFKAYGEKVAGDIVQTLLTCKRAHEQKEKSPLTDEEYDKLMGMYTKLNNADRSDLSEQLRKFRNGVGQLRAAARLYDAKMIASKSGSADMAGSIQTLGKEEYREYKTRVKSMGDGLVRQLQKLHRDPVLKSAMTDADYDRLVREHRQLDILDTVKEESLEDYEIPWACNEIYLRLVEVQGYREVFISGKALVDNREYNSKRSRAIDEAENFLSSDDSHRIGDAFREKIAGALADLIGQQYQNGQAQTAEAAPQEAVASLRNPVETLATMGALSEYGAQNDESPSQAQRIKDKFRSFLSTRSPSRSSCRSSSASGSRFPSENFADDSELTQVTCRGCFSITRSAREVHAHAD